MFYHNHCTCSVVFYFEYRVLSGCFLDKMDRFFIHISKKWVKALYYLALTHFLATILSTMPFFLEAGIFFYDGYYHIFGYIQT